MSGDIELIKERLKNAIEKVENYYDILTKKIEDLEDDIKSLDDTTKNNRNDIEKIETNTNEILKIVSFVKGSAKTIAIICSILFFSFEVVKFIYEKLI